MANGDVGDSDTSYDDYERAPYPDEGAQGPAESSIPWQRRKSYPSVFHALWETISSVLLSPSRAFSNFRVERSFGESLVFVLVLGCIGGFAAWFWQILWASMQVGMGFAQGRQAGLLAGMSLAVQVVVALILVPAGALLSSIVSAGILHLCLMIVGGANRTFEATYAVVAYAWGCTALFNILPCCGGLIGFIWNIVVQIIGVREAHRTTTGKAVLAVMLPVVLCLGMTAIIVVMLLGAVSGRAR